MTIKEAIHTLLHSEGEKDEEKAKQARHMGIDALEEISKRYPRCENCGNEINKLELTFVRQDGRKENGVFPLRDVRNSGSLSLVANNVMIKNVGKPEGVRCPHCKKVPFEDMEVHIYPCTLILCTAPSLIETKEPKCTNKK